MRAKTAPNSLLNPVPTTIPSPLPLLTRVPIKATLLRSLIGNPPTPPPCRTSIDFFAGWVSPVKADSSISREWATVRRRSAGIRSPVEKVIRSPGTSTLASWVDLWPSLRHDSTNEVNEGKISQRVELMSEYTRREGSWQWRRTVLIDSNAVLIYWELLEIAQIFVLVQIPLIKRQENETDISSSSSQALQAQPFDFLDKSGRIISAK